MSRRSLGKAVLAMGLCAFLLCTGCLGPGHATGHLFKFNRSFENRWAQEGMFLVMLPAYVIFGIGDQLIFNSVYWWTGDNPIDPPEGSGPDEFGL